MKYVYETNELVLCDVDADIHDFFQKSFYSRNLKKNDGWPKGLKHRLKDQYKPK